MSRLHASFSDVDHPALARDAAGNLLPFPEGTAAWRIARETGGRLFEIRGPDKAWARIPIEAVPEQVADQWGPGVYRVYALDALGGSLSKDHVARWDLRNAGGDVPVVTGGEPRSAASVPSSGSSDLRFALEAMSHMLRTNSDALRMVAESHVDLAKSIAAAKGLPRNANLAALHALTVADRAASEKDEEDEVEDEGEPPSADAGVPAWVSQVLIPLAPVIKLGSDFLSSKLTGKGPETSGQPVVGAVGEVAPENYDAALVNAPNIEARDFTDLNYAYRKGQAKRAHKAAVQAQAAVPSSTFLMRLMEDPAVAERVMAVQGQLPPNDVALLMRALRSLTEEQLTELVSGLRDRPPADAVGVFRQMVADLRAGGAQDIPAPGGAA